MDDILIYVDDGSSYEVLLREISRQLDHSKARLIPVMAEDITVAGLMKARTLIMPGGADLPYCARLNGQGNRCIRDFVEGGGNYLGICAGAYYACHSIIFHGGRSDEIAGSRELALINATAIGSLNELGPFYDLTVRSASVPLVDWEGFSQFHAYYHGGPRFDIHGHDVTVFARFPGAGGVPAGVECEVDVGKAVLTAAHLEVTPSSLIRSLSHLTDGDDYSALPDQLAQTDGIRQQAFRNLLARASIPLKS